MGSFWCCRILLMIKMPLDFWFLYYNSSEENHRILVRISGISKMACVFILSIPIVSANTLDYMQ